MSAWVWLDCSALHAPSTHQLLGKQNGQRKDCRVDDTLPAPSWFQEQLQQLGRTSGVQEEHDQHAHARRKVSSAVTIVALLQVKPAKLWEGPLGNWSREVGLHRAHLFFAEDAYTLEVQNVHVLPRPIRVFSKTPAESVKNRTTLHLEEEVRLSVRMKDMVFKPGQFFYDTCTCLFSESAESSSGGALLQTMLTTIVAIQVVEPIAFLITAGIWHEFVSLGRWPQICSGFPAESWCKARAGLHQRPDDGVATDGGALGNLILGPVPLQNLASALRCWAPAVLHNSADPCRDKLYLSGAVDWLERAAWLLNGAAYSEGNTVLRPVAAILCCRVKECL
jgi:hypothetical protein